MPWYNGDYPPSYENQPVEVRQKAVEIAIALSDRLCVECALNNAPPLVGIAYVLHFMRILSNSFWQLRTFYAYKYLIIN